MSDALPPLPRPERAPEPLRSAREEFVEAAVDYLLGRRTKPAGRPDDAEAPPARTTSVRGGAARRQPDRPAASALGIRLVAELTGRSHAAPLFHFPDRLSLVAAVAAEGFRQQTEAVLASAAPTPDEQASERLQRSALAYVTWASAAPALFATMYDPELAPVLEAFMVGDDEEEAVRERLAVFFVSDLKQAARRQQAYRELYDAKRRALDVFVGIAQQGIADGSLRRDVTAHELAHVVTSVADGLAWQRVTEQQFAGPLIEAHTRRMLRLCFEGLDAP